MTPPSAMTIPHPSAKQAASSSLSSEITKSQDGQTLGICLSIPPNLTFTLSLSDRTVWQTLSKKFSHSNSWVSLPAMVFLGQTIFQIWPPKPFADWACSIIQNPSLAHPNCDMQDFHPQLDGILLFPLGWCPCLTSCSA